MTEEMLGGQHHSDESDTEPSVRVNTRTPKIDALGIQRMGVSPTGQHPKKKSLATADLVRDTALIRS